MLKYFMLQLMALVVLVLLCMQLRSTYLLKASYQKREVDLTRSIAKLKDEIHYAHHQEVRLNNSFSVWQELYNNHVYHSSGHTEPESVAAIIERLSVIHRVQAGEITASRPVDVSDSYRKRYIKVENSKVSIKFSALTDKHAVLFMQAVRYDIPGFIAIKRFEVIKEREVTEEVINAYAEGKVLHTVSGTIVFELYRITGHHT